MTLPLVSIVTPTRDRPRYLQQCASYVARQTYAGPLEWIVVVTGDVDSLHLPKLPDCLLNATGSVGHLHNLGNRAARGRIIVQFDDDWQAPDRVEKQVAALMQPGVELVCSDDYLVYFGPGRACRSWTWGLDRFATGGTFAYWKETWERFPFPSVQSGEDCAFAQTIRRRGRSRNMRDPRLYAYIRHETNGCKLGERETACANPDDYERFRELVGADLSFYE